MKPTPRLRFVERQHGYKTTDGKDVMPNMVRVLQQFFLPDGTEPYEEWVKIREGKWQDVPLEAE